MKDIERNEIQSVRQAMDYFAGTITTMDEQVNIIACVPCLEGMQLGFTPYKNSTITRCEKCGTRVWLGPTCAEKRKEGIPVWCMKCIILEHGPDAVNGIRSLTNKGAGE